MSKVVIVKNKDKRMEYMMKYLEGLLDIKVVTDELHFYYEIEDNHTEYIILPIRGLNNQLVIDGTDIKITENYLKKLKGKCIYTGLLNNEIKNMCELNHIQIKTYLTDEIALKNNYITTEGIIEAIVNHSEKAIYNSNILIIGYGKLGQISSKVLKELKANISVSCRHEKDMLHAKICDFDVLTLQQIKSNINRFDFIINTIPFRVIDPSTLREMSHQLIIDVASAPYGLDHEYAKKVGIQSLLLPGIPGKIAPKTAGELIGHYIYHDIIGGEHDGNK